jgi:hypothetical protein
MAHRQTVQNVGSPPDGPAPHGRWRTHRPGRAAVVTVTGLGLVAAVLATVIWSPWWWAPNREGDLGARAGVPAGQAPTPGPSRTGLATTLSELWTALGGVPTPLVRPPTVVTGGATSGTFDDPTGVLGTFTGSDDAPSGVVGGGLGLPAGGLPAGRGTAGDALAGDALAGDALAGDALAGNALAGNAPAGNAPAGSALAAAALAAAGLTGDGQAGEPAAIPATQLLPPLEPVVPIPVPGVAAGATGLIGPALVPAGPEGAAAEEVDAMIAARAAGPPPAEAVPGNLLDADTSMIEGSEGEWQPWFSAAVSTSDDAHSGDQSLEVEVTAPYGWGVEQHNWPGFEASPGEHTISFWGKADSGEDLEASMTVRWSDDEGTATGSDTITLPLTDTWEEASATVTAPEGTTHAGVYFSNSVGDPGDVFLLDDIVVVPVIPVIPLVPVGT